MDGRQRNQPLTRACSKWRFHFGGNFFFLNCICLRDSFVVLIRHLQQAQNVMPNFKMTRLLYILTFFLLLGCGPNDNSKKATKQSPDTLITTNQNKADWTFEKVKGSKLIFKNNQTIDTKLFELEYIGQIPVDNKAPYLIFSGRDCDGCDANVSIYIYSPSDGQLNVDHGQNRYQYPGTVKDFETDSVLSISKAFYGQVLQNIYGAIWYEKRLLENGKMGRFIFLSHVDNGSLKDTIYEDNGTLNQTINLVKKGHCKEIAGRQFTSEP